ncbi:hypothetical protein Tco_0307260 [Tanacetum coccineum]
MERTATTASSLVAEQDNVRAYAKDKIVNGERQIQALVDKKKVIITETSIRSDLKLDDAKGIDCLPTASVFAELERIGSLNNSDDRRKTVTTAGEVVTTANVEATTANAPTTTIDELTLAQTLIEIKAAKPKAVTSAATTTTSTRPKPRGVVVQEPSESKTTSSPVQASQLPQAKDKGKAIMVEPERPLKKKDQVALDEVMARNLEAQMQAELIEEERLARQKEEEANIDLIESWDNTQAMMEADFELAQRLQAEEQGEITIEERSRFQLKSKSYDEIQKLFDKEMKRVNTFVDMNSKVVKGSETRTEESSKRAGDELESDKSKKQRIDEHVETKKDDDPEEEEMKRHMEIVQDEEEIAIDAIPLATKPPMIVEYKIVKKGQKGFYHLIRADGSSKIYSSMIRILQGIDKEDLETLWKLVKEKHGINRPVDE